MSFKLRLKKEEQSLCMSHSMCSNKMASTWAKTTLLRWWWRWFWLSLLFFLLEVSIKTWKGFSCNTKGSTRNTLFSFPTTTVMWLSDSLSLVRCRYPMERLRINDNGNTKQFIEWKNIGMNWSVGVRLIIKIYVCDTYIYTQSGGCC